MPKIIYKDESAQHEILRKDRIEDALKVGGSFLNRGKQQPIHAEEIVAVAKLLQSIEQYDETINFDNNSNEAYYAQQMAQDLDKQLQRFLTQSKGKKKDDPVYKTNLSEFKNQCTEIINKNIAGMSLKSTFWNCIAPVVNTVLKLFGCKPYELDTTKLAQKKEIKEALNQIKETGIAKQQIETTQEQINSEKNEESQSAPRPSMG